MNKLPLIIFILVCLILGIVCIAFPQELIQIFKIGQVWLLLAIILALSPWGKWQLGQYADVKLSNSHPNPKEPSSGLRPASPRVLEEGNQKMTISLKIGNHWLFKLFAIQIATSIVFWGLAHTILQSFPIVIDHYPINAVTASQQTIYDLTINWGLHPWPLALLIAFILAYFRQKTGHTISYYGALLPILKHRPNGTFALGNNVALRQSLFMLCSCTLLIILPWLQWLAYLIGGNFPHYAMTPIALAVFTAFIVCMSLQPWQQWTHYGWEHYWPLGRQLLLQTFLALCLVWAIYTVATLGMSESPTFWSQAIKLWFPLPAWPNAWRIFYWCWWLAATTLLSYWLSEIIKKCSIRQVVFWGLLLPSLWTLIAIGLPFFNPIWKLLFISPFFPIAALFIVVIYFFSSRDLDILIMTSLTWKTALPPSQQISLKMAQSVLQLSAIIIGLYLLSGLNFIFILCFIMIAPWLLFLVTITASALVDRMKA